jgi:hypothetical protein
MPAHAPPTLPPSGQHHRQNGAGNAEQRQQLSALGLRPVRLHGGEKIGGLEADAPRLRLPENNRRKRHVLPTLQRCDALAQRLARPILV